MTLSAGTKLGPYEIQSALGAGGMGEVCKARDTRLDLPQRIHRWSLASVQQRLVKTGGRLGRTRTLPLAPAGGESFDPTPVRGEIA